MLYCPPLAILCAFFFFVFSFGFAALLRAGSPSSPGVGFGVCLVLFFVCCCGCFFFFCFAFWRCSCPFGCAFVWFLWLSFRCSPSQRLGCGCFGRSSLLPCFLRLRCWSLRLGSWFVSLGFCFFGFVLRSWSWCVRCSFRCLGSFRSFGFSPFVGFFSWSGVSVGVGPFSSCVRLFLWSWFGFVGFACVCLRSWVACFVVPPCWGSSSCWLGFFLVGFGVVFSPLVQLFSFVILNFKYMPLVKNFVAGAFYSRSVANAQRKRLQSSHPRPLRVVSVWSFDSFIFYVVY